MQVVINKDCPRCLRPILYGETEDAKCSLGGRMTDGITLFSCDSATVNVSCNVCGASSVFYFKNTIGAKSEAVVEKPKLFTMKFRCFGEAEKKYAVTALDRKSAESVARKEYLEYLAGRIVTYSVEELDIIDAGRQEEDAHV